GCASSSPAVHPFTHSRPAFTGNAGSPAIRGAPSPVSVSTVPHWKAQYGQCVRTPGGESSCGRETDTVAPRAPLASRVNGYTNAHEPTDPLDRVGRRRTHAGLIARAGLRIEAEGVQRADHLFAREHPVGQRATLVRAAVGDGEHLAGARAEDRDRLAADAERPAQPHG